MIPPTCLALIGGWLAFSHKNPAADWPTWIGGAMTALGVVLVGALVAQLRQPRISYHDGQLMFHLRSGQPIAIPVELVDAFFLGQGPFELPGGQSGGATVNLVARISQRATDWAQRDVKPALGQWCDGYVTIRGAWCEPLTGELVRRLNRRLREVTEQCAT